MNNKGDYSPPSNNKKKGGGGKVIYLEDYSKKKWRSTNKTGGLVKKILDNWFETHLFQTSSGKYYLALIIRPNISLEELKKVEWYSHQLTVEGTVVEYQRTSCKSSSKPEIKEIFFRLWGINPAAVEKILSGDSIKWHIAGQTKTMSVDTERIT